MCGVVECGFPIKNDFFLPTIKYKQFLDNMLLYIYKYKISLLLLAFYQIIEKQYAMRWV